MKSSVIVLFVSLFSPTTAIAADSDERYSNYGSGTQSCETYVKAREDSRNGEERIELVFLTWLNGFLSAHNYYVTNTYDIKGTTDNEALLVWLENYCKQNPRKSFSSAVAALADELYPKRIQQAPK
ncbi:MAG: HdeA family protein [Gammaproteobacteria bacterium]|nr:HdeA family protein [Gammaproteobacteria bacterium]MDH3405415.1 HdeA family protein [Gammaproteobacteria bacterium]MDH3563025.1 HdeA family protein [Gammaproteobacteria bacterium]MDH5486811.1 HdeA family protein [Gammaproteobacteria bacterium]